MRPNYPKHPWGVQIYCGIFVAHKLITVRSRGTKGPVRDLLGHHIPFPHVTRIHKTTLRKSEIFGASQTCRPSVTSALPPYVPYRPFPTPLEEATLDDGRVSGRLVLGPAAGRRRRGRAAEARRGGGGPAAVRASGEARRGRRL